MSGVSAGAVGRSTTVLRRMETRPGTSAARMPWGARRTLVALVVLVLALVLSGVLARPATAQPSEPSDAEAPVIAEADGAAAGQAVAEDGVEDEAAVDGSSADETAEDGVEDEAAVDAGADDEAEDEVRLIVGLLVGVSVVAVVLTVLFWYHTIPSRRVIAARRRRARAARSRSARRSRASGPDDLRTS